MELRAKKDELQEAVDAKNRFISILAHDLRGAFNGLLGFSELLKDNIKEYDTEYIDVFIKRIYETSKNTYSLLEELLEWAKTQQDKVDFKPQKVSLLLIADNCIKLLSNASKFKNIQIICDISPEIYVYGDINMINAIFRNLITNAIKFTPNSGQIRISTTIIQKMIEIVISDTGVGMDTKTINSLFKLGQTKSKVGTEGERGTGFGLLLCKEFVEKHSGKIWVESELGKGSDFKFTIPISLS
jgi:signal transduction histidine kinase